jgi:allophanate hydrolase subunit 1
MRAAGDRAVLIEVEDNHRALRLADAVRLTLGDRVEDVVPGHRTVLVTWPAGATDPRPALGHLTGAPLPAGDGDRDEVIELEVRYDGPDLAFVAAHAGVGIEEVVAIHTAAEYRAGFLGFAPGFAFLLGGDPRLIVPRRPEPRQAVGAGSVALAGPYSAIYPSDSPGGWQLIGTTEAVLFDLERDRPSLLVPGAKVRFRAIR